MNLYDTDFLCSGTMPVMLKNIIKYILYTISLYYLTISTKLECYIVFEMSNKSLPSQPTLPWIGTANEPITWTTLHTEIRTILSGRRDPTKGEGKPQVSGKG